MSEDMELAPLRHQQQLMTLPFQYRDVSWFMLVGGYGAAKSFADVFLILELARYYNGYQVRVGLGSTNIQFFLKTIGADLDRILVESGLKYRFDGQKNYYQIGTVRFYIIPMEMPKNVYGFSYNAFIDDEGDERPQEKFLDGAKAIKERCRVPFPSVTPEEKKYQAMYKERMKIVPRSEWNTDAQIVEWKKLAHRPPFVVFSSTAQGLKGLYRLYLDLKEKKTPFILIRARTKDNVYNDPEYYWNLYNIYTEPERRAYLDGEWENLAAGRVYPQFNPETCVIDDFELDEFEEVTLGQDLNLNASCATGFVVRNGIMYACREYTFKDFSQAAKIISQSLPAQKKVMWPDASGTFILSGYVSDMMQNGIDVRRMPKNPSIEERIMLINKLFATGRLKVFKSLKQSIMAWQTRNFDDNGKPSKASRHPEPSDYNDSSEYAVYQIASTRQEFFDIFSLVNGHGR